MTLRIVKEFLERSGFILLALWVVLYAVDALAGLGRPSFAIIGLIGFGGGLFRTVQYELAAKKTVEPDEQ